MRKKLTDKESDWKRTSSADKRLKPWYSPSHSYLNVHKQKDALKVMRYIFVNISHHVRNKCLLLAPLEYLLL